MLWLTALGLALGMQFGMWHIPWPPGVLSRVPTTQITVNTLVSEEKFMTTPDIPISSGSVSN